MAIRNIRSAENYFEIECYWALKPLIWALIPCGLDLRYEMNIGNMQEKFTRCYQIILNILTGLLLLSCLGYAVSTPFFIPPYYPSVAFISLCVASIGICTDVTILRIILIIRNNKIKSISNHLRRFCIEIPGHSGQIPFFKGVATFIRGWFAFLAFIFSFGLIIDCYRIAFDPVTKTVVDESVAGDNIYLTTLLTVAMILLGAASILVTASYVFFVLLYLSLCLIIINVFEYLKKLIKSDQQQIISPSNMPFVLRRRIILDFIKGHQIVCHVVKLMDEVFQESIAIRDLFAIVCFIFISRSFNLGNEDQYVDYEIVFIAVWLLLTFVLRTLFTARINEQVRHEIHCQH